MSEYLNTVLDCLKYLEFGSRTLVLGGTKLSLLYYEMSHL